MPEATISLGQRPVGEPLAEELNTLEEQDAALYQTTSPRGNFTAKALNNLVAAVNKVLPLFDQTPDYPKFEEDIEVFPEDFTRILTMVIGAANDAVEAEAITPDHLFSLEEITDDAALTLVSAKLDMLSKNKDFKKFLKEPIEIPTEEEAPAEEEIGAPVDIDALFEERL